MVATTGWSRANARLAPARGPETRRPGQAVPRKPRPRPYGHDTLNALIRIWNLAGRPSGKCVATTMGIWLSKLEEHGELGTAGLDGHVREQLLSVSGATIDRLLKPNP